MLRTGLLLPRSTLFPTLGHDILNGIKSCLHHYGMFDEFKLLTDNIGFGIDDQEIYTKAEKFLLQEDADIVLVVADNRVAEMLSPLFAASNKLLLVVNFGVNYGDSWRALPATIVHSLNFSLHTRLTGQLAGGTKAAYAISYLDGGYRQCYSMLNAHQQAGGESCFPHVTHFKKEDFTLQPLSEFLEANTEVRSLLALFSGDTASFFYDAIIAVQKKLDIDIYAGPMMLDGSVKDFAGKALDIKNVKGYTAWVPQLDNENNHLFKQVFETKAGKRANIFAVLGWDAGLLLREWLYQYKQGERKTPAMIQALSEKILASPRGWMKLDPTTGHTYAPSWLVQAKGDMELTVQGEKEDIDKEWFDFTHEQGPVGDSSSWKNTYLCI